MKRRRTNEVKSAGITSTPEKNRLLLQQQSKKHKFQKPTASKRDSTSSSESSIEISYHSDSSDDFDSEVTSDVEVLDDASVTQEKKVKEFVLVKVFLKANTFRHFIARIIDEQDDDGDYKVKFMKASFKIKNAFFFPRRMT